MQRIVGYLSFSSCRTPLGFVRPTLLRKERFAEFKGNKQAIKRFNAIMYLKSGSWQISDIEINFKSCNGFNRRFSQAHDVRTDRVVKYIVVYRQFLKEPLIKRSITKTSNSNAIWMIFGRDIVERRSLILAVNDLLYFIVFWTPRKRNSYKLFREILWCAFKSLTSTTCKVV